MDGVAFSEDRTQLSHDQPSLLKSFSAGFEDNDSVFLFRDKFGTLFVPYGSYRQDVEPENRIGLWQSVAFETSCDEAVSIEEHMEVHKALRVLLSIIYWRGIAIDDMRVKRNDEHELDIVGMSYPASYRDIVTNAANAWADLGSKRTDYRFSYDAIGSEGISRWLVLNDKHFRNNEPSILPCSEQQACC